MIAQLQPHIVNPQPADVELPNLNPTSKNQTYAQALSADRQLGLSYTQSETLIHFQL